MEATEATEDNTAATLQEEPEKLGTSQGESEKQQDLSGLSVPESKGEEKSEVELESKAQAEEKQDTREPESTGEEKSEVHSESKGGEAQQDEPASKSKDEQGAEVEPEYKAEGEEKEEAGAPVSKDDKKGDAEKPQMAEQRRPPMPSLLKELGLKVTAKGVLLPESRKTLLRRRRETRQAALGNEATAALAVPAKRKVANRDGPVLLDEIESDLFYGAHQGSVSACAGAVAKGADINVRNKADLDGIGIGATALHVAAVRGHEDVAAALLHAKADAMALTGRGETPVQLATRMGHVEVVKVLRTAGAAPKHAEGVVQLMSQAPSAWRDGQRKKLRKALSGANEVERPKETLPPPPPPPGVWDLPGGPTERKAQERTELEPLKGKGKGKGKGKRRRKGKEGKPDHH